MKRFALPGIFAALGLGLLLACNNVGTCPSPSSVKDGASCSGDNLTCAANIDSTCGTSDDGGVAQTSCTCTNGVWACGVPLSCATDGGDDATTGDDASNPDGSSGEGGDDGATDSGSTKDTGSAADTGSATDTGTGQETGASEGGQDAGTG